jgi:HNH endonuclease
MPELVQIVEGPLDTPCWLFGAVAASGYGMIYYQGRQQGLHRVSWQINRRCQIPPGLVICHLCDVKGCFNPKHLFAGTQLDNMADWSVKYGRRSVKDRLAAEEVMAKIIKRIEEKLMERKFKRRM